MKQLFCLLFAVSLFTFFKSFSLVVSLLWGVNPAPVDYPPEHYRRPDFKP